MNYRVTCLTPTLAGDGRKLAPIDYMVWKDQVNVLDQERIFRLLAKGPRLEGYLTQIKKADKLDFASWGGFAQNYAGRRIPFESETAARSWSTARADQLFIPTFAANLGGPYLPASALKGALRTAAVAAESTPDALRPASEARDARSLRAASAAMEAGALGGRGADAMRVVQVSDSRNAGWSGFQVFLLRTATLEARGGEQFRLAWKLAGRGAVERPGDGALTFAEMARPGQVFEGEWRENAFLRRSEIGQMLRRRRGLDPSSLLRAATSHSERLLAIHKQYAEAAGLQKVRASLEDIGRKAEQVRDSGSACVLALGWGAGFHSKCAFPDTAGEPLRAVLRQTPFYARAITSGLPFPKTRRVVFEANEPASLPGWVLLELT